MPMKVWQKEHPGSDGLEKKTIILGRKVTTYLHLNLARTRPKGWLNLQYITTKDRQFNRESTKNQFGRDQYDLQEMRNKNDLQGMWIRLAGKRVSRPSTKNVMTTRGFLACFGPFGIGLRGWGVLFTRGRALPSGMGLEGCDEKGKE